MYTNSYNASEAWKQELAQEGGYEYHCYSKEDVLKNKRLGRIWKKIIHTTKLKPTSRLFELGCGGGTHLARLALNGFEVHGIDVSDAVTARAENYLEEIRKFHPIKASVEVANIFEYETSDSYDMCYHFGVVEHFLELSQRQEIWRRLYDFTKPGGWIVSVVPCGQHIMRKLVREQGLAGYNIPEIDYSCNSHRIEFQTLGLNPIHVIPCNYFSFFSHHPSQVISQIVYPLSFILGNILIPPIPIPENIKETWAHTLIVIGRKTSVQV